jgi:hypothetical protein
MGWYLVPILPLLVFATHTAERNHAPFLFSEGNLGLLYVIDVAVGYMNHVFIK